MSHARLSKVRRSLLAVCALALALALVPHAAVAYYNQNATASLSWSPTTVVSDLTTPGSLTNLYVRVDGVESFKGAEFDLSWTPAGDGDACAAHIGSLIRTSTDCTYLNRGASVPVVTADDPGHFHIAWSNTEGLSSCASGNIIAVQFAFDGCADPTGCFTLHGVQLLDGGNATSSIGIATANATVLGGTADCAANNRAPVLSPIGPQAVGEGSTLLFSVFASDDDSDPLTYAASPLPAGATFSGRTFQWTPGANTVGDYLVDFSAADPAGARDDEAVTITVTPAAANHAPQFATLPAQSTVETRTLSFAVQATDPDHDPLTYSILAEAPSGSSFAGSTFTWTPAVGQAGLYAVTFRVSDPAGAADTLGVTVQVGPVGTPNDGVRGWLSWSSTGVQGNLAHSGDALQRLYLRLDGTGSFAGGEADLTWLPSSGGDSCFAHLSTNFKGGQSCDFLNRGVTTPLVSADDANHFHVQWTNSYANTVCAGGNALVLYFAFDGCAAAQGCFTLNSLTVTDALGTVVPADIQGATALVLNGATLCGLSDLPPTIYPIPDQTVAEGALLSLTVTAQDPEGDPLVYSALNLPQGATFAGQTFAWTPAQGQSSSEYDVTFLATDPAGLSGSDVVHIVVTASPGAYFVDQTSPCSSCDGRSWATAVHTIAEGLAAARTGVGDSVFVAQGSYGETNLRPSAATVLIGGFPSGGGTTSYFDTPTILRPGTAATTTPVLVLDAAGVTAQALRITGIRQGVLAVQVLGANATLRGLTVTQNTFRGNPVLRFEPTATHALVDHCILAKNISTSPLGSIYIAAGADVALLNTVVAFDTIRAVNGTAGIACDGELTATNSVFWSLRPAVYTPIKLGASGVADVNYCGIQDGWPGTGNLPDAPQFCDPVHGLYSLKSSSPYIGAGENGSDIGCLGVGCDAAPLKNPQVPEPAAASALPAVTAFLGTAPRVGHGEIVLRYALARAERVVAEAFDARGSRVAVLLDARQPAGPYAVRASLADAAGTRLAAGVYVLRFRAGSLSHAERLMIIR